MIPFIDAVKSAIPFARRAGNAVREVAQQVRQNKQNGTKGGVLDAFGEGIKSTEPLFNNDHKTKKGLIRSTVRDGVGTVEAEGIITFKNIFLVTLFFLLMRRSKKLYR